MYYKKFKLAVFVGIVFFGFSSCGDHPVLYLVGTGFFPGSKVAGS